ncbi:NUDIX domain-containing protein [Arcticibacter pallidicorallinus]|uniref:NUDIX domain-containing protein n=1 Tax=Arcticibacter pallidicorallinus TaxID=1259464 RepID=A0A2T0U0I5_9SPHI|nr:NUDIX domain-containing protein [Arcticibacter pallidicorallinus]PRY51456.1 NUDIX domain-containing protein [Arcticibacter pallidicorallinus]
MYRIYINETALIISEFVPTGLGKFQNIDPQLFVFRDFYKQAKKTEPGIYLILVDNAKEYFKKLRKAYQVIKAAGGVVSTPDQEYLFIFRKGKWDLPKGKLDEGEKTRSAAVREVEEECGIRVGRLLDKLTNTWHVYEERNEVIFKKTSWYTMEAAKQKLVPQLEEDITDARWMSEDHFGSIQKNTYPTIMNILELIKSPLQKP